jgi:hypothetical protein
MLKRFTLCKALLLVSALGLSPAFAAEMHGEAGSPSAVALAHQPLGESTIESGSAGAGRQSVRAVQAAMTTIVTWLAENFDLPPMFDHPRIEYTSPGDMPALRYQGLLGATRRDASVAAAQDRRVEDMRELVAFYNNRTRTIYLPTEWNAHSTVDLSILVHEMVHHLQNVSGMTFECPMGREKTAYRAQNKWLGLSGRSLESEFGIDAMTILVTTSCAFP